MSNSTIFCPKHGIRTRKNRAPFLPQAPPRNSSYLAPQSITRLSISRERKDWEDWNPKPRRQFTSPSGLRNRVKSIESTLDQYGSRASLKVSLNRRDSDYKPYSYEPTKYYNSPEYKSLRERQPEVIRSRKPSKHAYKFGRDSDDEEIEKLFKELEKLALTGQENVSKYEQAKTFPVQLGPYVSHNVGNTCTNMPRMFQCKGCGDLQPIYTPTNCTNSGDPNRYSSIPQLNSAAMGNNDCMHGNLFQNYPNSVPPFGYPPSSANSSYPQALFKPPYIYGFPPGDRNGQEKATKDLHEVIKNLSEVLKTSNKPKRSVGTQSVEDLNSENYLDEDEIFVEKSGNEGLQSGVPDDNLRLDNLSPHPSPREQFYQGLPKTARQLRELELSAWAAAKWWNLVKTRRELRRQYGFAADNDDETCLAEYPSRNKLQSAQNDLNFLDKHLDQELQEPAPRKKSTDAAEKDAKTKKEHWASGLPKGFSSFKQLSATAKASYKWAELVQKRKKKKSEERNNSKY